MAKPVGSRSFYPAWLIGSFQSYSSWSKSPFYNPGEQISYSLVDLNLTTASTKTANTNIQASMGLKAMGLLGAEKVWNVPI